MYLTSPGADDVYVRSVPRTKWMRGLVPAKRGGAVLMAIQHGHVGKSTRNKLITGMRSSMIHNRITARGERHVNEGKEERCGSHKKKVVGRI